jgi:hypothetical protein
MLLAIPGALALGGATPLPSIAVAQLDFVDTSGEVPDQTAVHAERIGRFAEALRKDLAATGHYRIVILDCGACSAGDTDPASLIDAAKRAGAELLFFGGVHKQSSLLMWAKTEIVDIAADKVVFDRSLSFRGDNDDAWVRAEAFLAKDIAELKR